MWHLINKMAQYGRAIEKNLGWLLVWEVRNMQRTGWMNRQVRSGCRFQTKFVFKEFVNTGIWYIDKGTQEKCIVFGCMSFYMCT